MDEHGTFVNTMIASNLSTRGGILLLKAHCLKTVHFGKPIFLRNPDAKVIDVLSIYCSFAGARLHSLLYVPLFFLFFVSVAISYQLQNFIHRIWMNMVQFVNAMVALFGNL